MCQDINLLYYFVWLNITEVIINFVDTLFLNYCKLQQNPVPIRDQRCIYGRIIFLANISRTRKSMTKNKSALVSQSEGLSLWESKRKSTTLSNYNFSYTPYVLHLALPRDLEGRPNSIVWLSFIFEISGIIVKMQNICNLIG